MDEILNLFGGVDNIWAAIKNSAGKVGIESTRIMLELYYVLKSPETSMLNKTLIVTALGYQLLPNDLLPRKKYGLLGYLDNIVTIGFAYYQVKSSVTPQIEAQVNNVLNQWFGGASGDRLGEGVGNGNNPQGSDYLTPRTVPTQDSSYQPQKPIWDDDDDVVID